MALYPVLILYFALIPMLFLKNHTFLKFINRVYENQTRDLEVNTGIETLREKAVLFH